MLRTLGEKGYLIVKIEDLRPGHWKGYHYRVRALKGDKERWRGEGCEPGAKILKDSKRGKSV